MKSIALAVVFRFFMPASVSEFSREGETDEGSSFMVCRLRKRTRGTSCGRRRSSSNEAQIWKTASNGVPIRRITSNLASKYSRVMSVRVMPCRHSYCNPTHFHDTTTALFTPIAQVFHFHCHLIVRLERMESHQQLFTCGSADCCGYFQIQIRGKTTANTENATSVLHCGRQSRQYKR